jgi:hypothetical protein
LGNRPARPSTRVELQQLKSLAKSIRGSWQPVVVVALAIFTVIRIIRLVTMTFTDGLGVSGHLILVLLEFVTWSCMAVVVIPYSFAKWSARRPITRR